MPVAFVTYRFRSAETDITAFILAQALILFSFVLSGSGYGQVAGFCERDNELSSSIKAGYFLSS
jgi:hypothetical protein